MQAGFDLRTALANALPGPRTAGTEGDVATTPAERGNDMKSLFDALDVSASISTVQAGPSASKTALETRRRQQDEREKQGPEPELESFAGSRAGGAHSGNPGAGGAAGGALLFHVADLGQEDVKGLGEDERHLRRVRQSKTKANMSSKQKRRQARGKEHGSAYEERYKGKMVNRAKRKNRLQILKTIY